MAIVRAAGGLLWREKDGIQIAVIHRPRRQDWSLPKGKLAEGESWEECALREVREETGCEGCITSFAGVTSYVPRSSTKIVLYWHMELVKEGKLDPDRKDEVDRVAWLSPTDAIARLDYGIERRLVERSPRKLADLKQRPSGALAAEVEAVRADLVRRATALEGDEDAAGLGPALDLVDRAESSASRNDAEETRRLLQASRRMALLSLEDSELRMRAEALLEESQELSPWRRRAIRKLLKGDGPSAEAVLLATEIRDEERSGGAPRVPRRAALLPLGAVGIGVGALLAVGVDGGTIAASAIAGAVTGAASGLFVASRRR